MKPKDIPLSNFNILILYDPNSVFTNTVREYLESFSLYSKNCIFYASGALKSRIKIPLKKFDVVVLHYSIRLSLSWFISPFYAEALQNYKGYKVLFIQDEYENTETARQWIERLGINAVFTCVPQPYVNIVYPYNRFPNVKFISIITGFVPLHLKQKEKLKPIKDREITIGYRGRELPYKYGSLGREKLIIGQKMKQFCQQNNIICDIEWDDRKRIYGQDWYDFIENCRATLGTESGSNIFDDFGKIGEAIKLELKNHPHTSYDEIHQKYLYEHENIVIMNQISPRIFEAISLKTALILFEGNYSNVIEPNKHFIPLKKDFSNINDVIGKLKDIDYLERLVDSAYKDIIETNLYDYKQFVKIFDDFLRYAVNKTNCISSFEIQNYEFQLKMDTELKIKYHLNILYESIFTWIHQRSPLALNKIRLFYRLITRKGKPNY